MKSFRDLRIRRGMRFFLLALPICMLVACSLFEESPQQKADQLDTMLAAAGFHMIPADTPKKESLLQSLPPLKLRYYKGRDGSTRYWVADPYACMCVYKGDEAAYQRYENLLVQQQLAAEQRQTAELNQDAAMQMNMYDPFFFPF
ncbi:MAG TPA: hypothetical protein VKV28_08325 [Candidatus Binataceae bacterium]|nr:hypothetical protein [Candidatus Binataceae bacterium]